MLPFLSLLVTVAQAPLQKPLYTIEDNRRLVHVSSPELSPDGTTVAFVLSRQNYDLDRIVPEIDVCNLASGSIRTLTRDRPFVGAPHWSPDGKWLAFIAPDKESKAQVFALPISGGDALQVTHCATSVNSFSWSPDGQTIAFTAEDERPTLQGPEKFNMSFELGDDPYRTTETPMPIRLWVIPSAGGTATCLTKAGLPLQSMLPPGAPPNEPSWSYDGKSIYVVTQASASYGDANFTNKIEKVTVAGSHSEPLTGSNGWELFVAACPTADRIAYWNVIDTKSTRNVQFVRDASGARDACPKLDLNNFLGAWMPDGKSLLVSGNWEGTVGMWVQPLGGEPRRLELGNIVPANFFGTDASVGKQGQIVFSGYRPDSPMDIYYMASAKSKPVCLTHFNDWLAETALSEVRVITWKTHDGFTADGILTLPPNFDPKRKYPLIVYPHGGPQASSTLGFNPVEAAYAAKGYVIFEPNYRGSDNLGEAYMRAIWNDAGDGPGRDVLSGIKSLEREPWIDSKRESIMGWSYGGYMTAWLMGHDTRWKGAVIGAAVLDWTSMTAWSDFGKGVHYQFKGSLWKDHLARDYAEQSPISYVDKIVTPSMIVADTGDQRVPTAQSFVLFHALRERGIETKFVLYQANGHFPGDPVQRDDFFRRSLGWIQSHDH